MWSKKEMIEQLEEEYQIQPMDARLEQYTEAELAMLLLVASWIERSLLGEEISLEEFCSWKETFLQFIRIENESRGFETTEKVLQSWESYFNPQVNVCEIAYLIMHMAKQRINQIEEKEVL